MCAVRRYAIVAVDVALVVTCLERPHNTFHEGCVHGLVRAVVIYPTRHLINVFLPSVVIIGYHLKALLIELVNTKLFFDLVLVGDTKECLNLVLDRETVAVPTPNSGNLVSTHSPISRDHILDKGYEYCSVVRLSCGERRSVIEDYLFCLFIFN